MADSIDLKRKRLQLLRLRQQQSTKQPTAGSTTGRRFGSAVEGGPVESDTAITDTLRSHPTLAGLTGVAGGFAELAGNIPSSTLQLGKDIASGVKSMVTEPRETFGGLGSIASGAIEKALPGFQGGSKEDIAAFNAVADAVKERYGSMEKFSETAIKDPAGTAADLSIITGGLGLVGKATGIPKASKLLKTSAALDPISSTIVGTGKAFKKATPATRLVKAAAKFDKKSGLMRTDELADAFLKRGLNINRKSMSRLQTDLTEVGKKIDDMVVKTTKDGATILTQDVTKAIDDLIDNAAINGFEIPDIKVIRQMQDDFIKLHGEILTTKEAQKIKVGLGRGFKRDISETFKHARDKVRNVQRDTVKVRLEELHPGLKELNQEHGVMKELHNAIEKRILQLQESKVVSVEGLAAGGIAGGIAGTSRGLASGLKFGAAAVVVDKIIESPRIQIKIAQALNKANMAAAQAGKLIPVATKAGFQAERTKTFLEDLKGQAPQGKTPPTNLIRSLGGR